MLSFAKLELGNSWFVLLLLCALKKLFEISQLASVRVSSSAIKVLLYSERFKKRKINGILSGFQTQPDT